MLDDSELDALRVVEELARPLGTSSPKLRRLKTALAASGSLAAVLDGLVSADANRRERAARMSGALRLDEAVPWLTALLSARETHVRVAACRALGRIGGAIAADALIAALRSRRLPPSRLVIEVARSAPDLYLECCLNLRRNASVRPSLVAALALRRRRTALNTLCRLAVAGSQRERTYACRGLAWLGDPTSSAYVALALDHRSWRVRQAAVRSLGQLGDRSHLRAVLDRLQDPNPRTRAAADQAVRILTPAAVK
jgi:HEAT repeat protein